MAEYFAGIGLARVGLEQAGFTVAWSNDISAKKHAMFAANFADSDNHVFHLGDLGQVEPLSMPKNLDIAWASFPCTDLSLAGTRAGLHAGAASSTFWHFIKNLSRLKDDRPSIVVLENVTAFATSRAGKDIVSAIRSLNGLGYSVDILSIDARRFVPQSRPRLFLVGVRGTQISTSSVASEIRPKWLDSIFDDASLTTHRAELPAIPPLLNEGFGSLAEVMDDDDARWWDEGRTSAFVNSLSDMQTVRLLGLIESGGVRYRTAYRRMREGSPRWEIRRDDIAGCLRTASGGSSRQAVVQTTSQGYKIRWMTPREYARLMGAPDYRFEETPANAAYSGFGDAVCVPVVRWIGMNYLQDIALPAHSRDEENSVPVLGDLVPMNSAVAV